MTLTVKNTFIDVEVPEEEYVDKELHARGAQTCIARMSAGQPSVIIRADTNDKRFNEELGAEEKTAASTPPEPWDPTPQDRIMINQSRRWADYTPGAAGGSPVSYGRLTQSCFARFMPPPPAVVSNASQPPPLQTQPPPQVQAQAPMVVPQRGAAAPQQILPQAPPPCYAAPQTFEEQKPMPPPPSAPGSVGHHVLLAAMTSSLGAPVSPQRDPKLVGPLPPGCPSQGSMQHGTLDAEGQPACQPCAWFYKVSGCNNGAACRRCHLCPEGELKTRKKQKIARLRNQDGVGASPTSPDDDATPPAS